MVSATATKRASIIETSRCQMFLILFHNAPIHVYTIIRTCITYLFVICLFQLVIYSLTPFFANISQPENVLVDRKGNIKISDFGLSALPQHIGVWWFLELGYLRWFLSNKADSSSYSMICDFQNDGLLHTTCGSPNYIAPEVKMDWIPFKRKWWTESILRPNNSFCYTVSNSCAKCLQVLQNRGYDGSLSDIWSCGVILYLMLLGYLPFDDRNIVVLYQKVNSDKSEWSLQF